MFEYKTVATKVEDVLIKEKGSKFISFLYPISDEQDLKNRLNYLQEIHPKATHHCYAFRLGLNGEKYRANDDGEPSGSAGLPIYNQLLANEITNILLVVIRYYGGTKLGVSGLVKAYKESAKYAIEQAEIITKELETKIVISFPFDKQNVIFTTLNKLDATMLDFQAEQECTIIANIKTAQKESISETLSEMKHITFEFIED